MFLISLYLGVLNGENIYLWRYLLSDDYVVFTRKLRDYLLQKGCNMISTKKSFKKPGFDVYVFKKTEAL